MQMTELFEVSLSTGEPFVINEHFQIRIPQVGEIIRFGERRYYNIVHAFTATSSDYKAQLFDMGQIWEDVSDYQMFVFLFADLRKEDLSLLFGDADLSNLKLARDTETGEYVFLNEETGAKIDSVIYEYISGFLCAMHGKTKTHERAGNEAARQALIEDAKEELDFQRDKPYEAYLRPLVLAMANTPEFKDNFFHALEYPISIFMDSVEQVHRLKHYNYVMQGIYSGTVDVKKIPKSQLNWLNLRG